MHRRHLPTCDLHPDCPPDHLHPKKKSVAGWCAIFNAYCILLLSMTVIVGIFQFAGGIWVIAFLGIARFFAYLQDIGLIPEEPIPGI